MIYKAAQLDKYLKKPESGIRGFLIYGSNEGLVAEYLRKLILSVSADLYDPFAVAYLEGADVNADVGVLAAEYNSRSLIGGRRAVVVKDADNNLTKHLKALLENGVNEDALLIICGVALNKKSSLVSLAEKRDDFAVIACYEDRDEDISASVRSKFVEAGVTIGRDALDLLRARLSNDRKSNLGEIDKLITYIGDKKNVTVEDVRAAVSDQSSMSGEDLCYFTAGGMIAQAQAALGKMLAEGEDAVGIVRALSYHFGRLLVCKSDMEKGQTADAAVNSLVPKLLYFRVPDFKRQLFIWPREKILGALELLYKCEKDCKTTNMPAEEVLSYAVLQLAGGAAKLAQR